MLTTVLGIAMPFLFRFLEKQFGPKTGATKMQLAVDSIMPILQQLATAGKLDGPAPGADDLRKELEKLLAQERAKPDWQEAGTLKIQGQTFIVTVVGRV